MSGEAPDGERSDGRLLRWGQEIVTVLVCLSEVIETDLDDWMQDESGVG